MDWINNHSYSHITYTPTEHTVYIIAVLSSNDDSVMNEWMNRSSENVTKSSISKIYIQQLEQLI